MLKLKIDILRNGASLVLISRIVDLPSALIASPSTACGGHDEYELGRFVLYHLA